MNLAVNDGAERIPLKGIPIILGVALVDGQIPDIRLLAGLQGLWWCSTPVQTPSRRQGLRRRDWLLYVSLQWPDDDVPRLPYGPSNEGPPLRGDEQNTLHTASWRVATSLVCRLSFTRQEVRQEGWFKERQPWRSRARRPSCAAAWCLARFLSTRQGGRFCVARRSGRVVQAGGGSNVPRRS